MRTLVVRVNPLVQMSVGLLALLGSFWVRSLPVGLIALGAYVVAALVLLPGWRFPAACLAFSAVAGLTIVYSTWRLGGHDVEEAVTAGLRIVVLAWPGSVMAGYVDPSRLADHAAQRLHAPARLVAALSAALQRLTTLSLAWQQLERVRRVRGVGPGSNPLASVAYAADISFALLVHAMRGATATSVAMDARGFATARRRTWAEPAPWTRLDTGGLVVATLLAAVPVVAHTLV
jgi:energy-coupling factor transport system permease protein